MQFKDWSKKDAYHVARPHCMKVPNAISDLIFLHKSVLTLINDICILNSCPKDHNLYIYIYMIYAVYVYTHFAFCQNYHIVPVYCTAHVESILFNYFYLYTKQK